MKTPIIPLLKCLRVSIAVIAICAALTGVVVNAAVDLYGNRELFVDDFLIDRIYGLTLKMHHPVPAGVALKWDKPWEGPLCEYVTVIRDTDRFHMYYCGWPTVEGRQVTCYAESHDGIVWSKPSLGLFEYDGSKDNNIVWVQYPSAHNLSPFIDTRPGVPPEARFKAVGGHNVGTEKERVMTDKQGQTPGLYVLSSPDGIHWEKMVADSVFHAGEFDSQNVAFWSELRGKYILYYRSWSQNIPRGVRQVSYAESDDFIHWTDRGLLTYPERDTVDYYINQISPYYRAPQIYIGFPNRFYASKQVISKQVQQNDYRVSSDLNGIDDSVLITSRDGAHFDMIFHEAFVRPGLDRRNWTSRNNYINLNPVQTSETEMSLYVLRHHAQSDVFLERVVLRIDGFASLHGGAPGGKMTTKPFTFRGSKLNVNFSTSAGGSIQLGLLQADGTPIAGFSLNDAPPLIGDEISRDVVWSGGSLGSLAGKSIRLEVKVVDGDLFSFRFE